VWNKEVDALIHMVNDGLKVISVAHHCSVPYIRVSRSEAYLHYHYETRRWQGGDGSRRGKKGVEDEVQAQGHVQVEDGEEDEDEDVDTDEEGDEEGDEEYILALAIERSLRNA